MRRFSRYLTLSLAVVALALTSFAQASHAAEAKKSFKLAWSIYVGWMPWGWAADKGIVKKWADKYGVAIDVQRLDYIPSIEQYTAGAFDAVAATNMDTLAIPSAGGIDSTALIVGDFSNGNDAVILKNKKALADIKGQKVNLVELSVSHYLLARALQSIKLTEKDVTVVNTSDSEMIAAFGTPQVTGVVTWNPLVEEILKRKDATSVFNSSMIPGEIMDLLVVKTDTLKANPALGKALVGAWYETMQIMSSDTPAGKEARTAMGVASGTDLAGMESQLKTTRMFYKPAEAVAFAQGKDVSKTMDYVRTFLFEHGLLGPEAKSPDVVGISFPDGSVLGNKANVKFRFTSEYMDMAAKGKL